MTLANGPHRRGRRRRCACAMGATLLRCGIAEDISRLAWSLDSCAVLRAEAHSVCMYVAAAVAAE